MSVISENFEISLIIKTIYEIYGYDFSNYSKATIKRRLKKAVDEFELKNISDLIPLIIHDKKFGEELLSIISINVTEMFRDSDFYTALKNEVIPKLNSLQRIKVWIAGCSSGEEAYSVAILLKEASLLKKTQIYATDFDKKILEEARKGVFKSDKIRLYTKNYQESEGIESFSDYYKFEANTNTLKLNSVLKEKIIFSHHDLVSDESFGKMDLILCRNVLIYFNKQLQNKVIDLFVKSLKTGSFFCMGKEESLINYNNSNTFKKINQYLNIYEKR